MTFLYGEVKKGFKEDLMRMDWKIRIDFVGNIWESREKCLIFVYTKLFLIITQI